MTLTLNTTSGVLHRSARCAGRDTRFHVAILDVPGEQVIGVQFHEALYLVAARCRKCLA